MHASLRIQMDTRHEVFLTFLQYEGHGQTMTNPSDFFLILIRTLVILIYVPRIINRFMMCISTCCVLSNITLKIRKKTRKIVLWIQLGQKKNSLEFIKSTHLSWMPDQSMKIEKKDMKLQYFLKYPLLNVKKQKHKIQIKNHIKNLKINKNRTHQNKNWKMVFF